MMKIDLNEFNDIAAIIGKAVWSKLHKSERIQISKSSDEFNVGTNVWGFNGIYAFILEKDGVSHVLYFGKTQNNGRVYQHTYNRNLDVTPLADSVRTKKDELEKAKNEGFIAYVVMHILNVSKSILSLIEIELIEFAKA